MCTAVDSIHDIASGQYQSGDKDTCVTEDTLLQLLSRVSQQLKDPASLADNVRKLEIENQVMW